jgi:hypothetical protein
MSIVLNPILSSTAGTSKAYNPGIADTYSWVPVEGEALGRPLYARANYITNFSDLQLTLSASDVNIGAVHISDEDGRVAHVVPIQDYGNGLQVLTQDLESKIDDITIGDKQGHFANVDPTLSALDVRVANVTPLSAVITNTVAINTAQTLPISGSVTITNPITAVNAVVTNTVGVSAINLPVTVLNTIDTITTSNPLQLDAFGRFRVSQPLTLFDSSHRYRDNNLWSSLTAVSGTYAFNQNQGLMDLTVTAASGSSVIRETTKVFSYQPGKSLLVLNTFVFAPSATGLRQRTGYFGQDNGIYFQLDDGTISFVERSLVTGIPSETIVPLSGWNVDKMDGTGPSGFTLDITKAQISWMDIEWLGVGTVRCGFVIDGKFVHCHSFHHANRIASTYITTASLPLRYEITNKATTGVTRTMKQICSTVISEGGYELRGLQQSIGTSITAPKALAAQGTFYPVASIRLKASPNRLDSIVILTALSLMGVGTGIYQWKVFASSSTTGGNAWQSAGPDSSVEYKLDGTAVSGGRTMAEGYFTSNTQGSTTIDILKEALFKFQLERNGLTANPYELCVAVAASTNGELVHGSMDWEEISR